MSDLRAAAEQAVKRAHIKCSHSSGKHIWNAHQECQWCHMTKERYESAVIATAYLAEHPDDDDELVDEIWLRRLNIGVGRNQKRFELYDSIRILAFACEGPKRWQWALWIGKMKFCDDPIRGQVRRLLAALGIRKLPSQNNFGCPIY